MSKEYIEHFSVNMPESILGLLAEPGFSPLKIKTISTG